MIVACAYKWFYFDTYNSLEVSLFIWLNLCMYKVFAKLKCSDCQGCPVMDPGQSLNTNETHQPCFKDRPFIFLAVEIL